MILLRPRVIGNAGWEPELRRVDDRLARPEVRDRVRRLLGNEGWRVQR